MLKRFFLTMACAACAALVAAPVSAEPKHSKKAQPAEELEQVEMFEAMKEGKIEVQLIPKDSSVATVVITNKGDKPVNIKLPATFAGVPVLAQMGMGGMGMGGMGMGGGGMGGMGMGGGMGGMGMGGMGGGGMGGMGGMGMGGMGGMGGGGMGGMGGMFRVAPDKPGKFRVNCVCLEHGKTEPNSRVKYTVIPLDSFSKDPRVATVCRLLGQGTIGQHTAQAATWHLANGLSWEQLAHKNRSESKYTGNVPYFHPAELNAAMRLVNTIEAEQRYAESLAAAAADGTGGSLADVVPTNYAAPAR